MEAHRLEPHWFERDGATYEVRFERGPGAWHAHIRRVEDGAAASLAFPDGAGYAADDVRGSLIAGCEAAAAQLSQRPPTRH